MEDWYQIEVDAAYIAKQRRKAQELKKSQWWKTKLSHGLCHYCEKKFSPRELTMDHIVPVARGGTSTKGNVVPCCKSCNQNKKLNTPVDLLLSKESGDKES